MTESQKLMAHNFLATCPYCQRRVEFMRSGSPELSREEVETLVRDTNLARVKPELYRRLCDALTRLNFYPGG